MRVQESVRKWGGCLPADKPIRWIFCTVLVLFGCVRFGGAEVLSTYSIPTESVESRLIPGLVRHEVKRPGVGLALSGGGLKGLAHIGVLRALEEADIPIDYITGTSSGSIIGGFYAMGYSISELDSIARAIHFDELFIDQTQRKNLFISQKEQSSRYLLDVRFDNLKPFIPIAISSGQRIVSQLTRLYLQAPYNYVRDFSCFTPEFRAVATDLESGERVVLKEGDVVEAIRASMSIPMVLAPVRSGEYRLIDGGVADNIPIELARDLGAEMVIAVDVRSKLYEPNELKNMLTVADQVINILINASREEVLDDADIVIAPDFREEQGENPEDAATAIRRGYQATTALLDSIKNIYRQLHQESRVTHRVDTIRVRGYSTLTESQVRELMNPIYPPDREVFTDATVDSLLTRLYDSGYFREVMAVVADSGGVNSLEILVEEYPTVREVSVEGVSAIPPWWVLRQLSTMEGVPYNTRMLKQLLTEILRRYRADGYPMARIDTVEWQPESGRLDVRFSEGVIEEIRVSGNELTRKYVITRESALRAGTLLNERKVEHSVTNIYSTGLFSYVGVGFEPGSGPGRWVVNFQVEEKKYLGVRFGYRINSHRGNAGLVSLEDQNFRGHGVRVNLDAKIGEFDRYVQTQYTSYRFFRTYLTYDLRAGYRWTWYRIYDGEKDNQQYNFSRERSFFEFSLGHHLARLGLVDFTFTAQRVLHDGPRGLGQYNQDYALTSLSVQSIIDTKDRAAFPRSGNYQRIYYESATARFELAGDIGFTKFEFLSEWYFTFISRHTVHPRIHIGIGDETVPFSEWFSIGGLNSVMGLNPYHYWAQKIGVGSLEYRYRLPVSSLFDLQFFLRYDIAGKTNRPVEELSEVGLFTGRGIGVGVNTPAGPVKLAYGESSLGHQVVYFDFGWRF